MLVKIALKSGILLSLIIYAKVAAQHCEKITAPACQHLGYNTTFMPNFMGHDDQREAVSGLQTYGALLEHNCSSFLRLFVCSVYFPLCSEHVSVGVSACRGLCEEVKKDCLSALLNAGFDWPEELECSRFPEPTELCIQQPSEEDFRDLSPNDHLHNLKTTAPICPPNTVPGHNQKCLKKCNINESISQNNKILFAVWTIFWSFLCLVITLFALLTFFTQRKRFRWPARPILYLTICGFVRSLIFLTRWSIGPFICSDSAILEKPTDSLWCTIVALMLVYIDLTTACWWCVFSFAWFLSAAKEWSTEAIEKISAQLHGAVWSLSIVPLMFILISKDIRLNELTGFCQISNYILVILQLCIVTAGSIIGVFTSIALKNVRKALVYEGRCPYKLERLILRLCIIGLGVFLSLFFSLLCNIFDHFYALLIQVSLQFLSAIFASLWVFSSKTFKSWNKILCPASRNKGGLQNRPSTKI